MFFFYFFVAFHFPFEKSHGIPPNKNVTKSMNTQMNVFYIHSLKSGPFKLM